MQTFRVMGQVDHQGHLVATVPESFGPGEVEVVVIARKSSEDEAGDQWMAGVAHQWHDDLADPRQDIYSPTDGVPTDGRR